MTDEPSASGHEHTFDRRLATWPSGPDGEFGQMKGCACGAVATFTHEETAPSEGREEEDFA